MVLEDEEIVVKAIARNLKKYGVKLDVEKIMNECYEEIGWGECGYTDILRERKRKAARKKGLDTDNNSLPERENVGGGSCY